MRLVIPLPWYSREAYDISNDAYRGGWRRIHIKVEFSDKKGLGMWGGFGFGLAFWCGIGTKFSREGLQTPQFRPNHELYTPLWARLRRWWLDNRA